MAAGPARTQLTTTRSAGGPRWSPDGTQVAFVSKHGDTRSIWVIPAGGGDPTQLTTDQSNESAVEWSPDGRQIVFTSTRAGSPDVWVMPADGGEAAPLTSGVGNDFQPRWSLDGAWVPFCRFAMIGWMSGSCQPRGRAPTQITADEEGQAHLRWSPDGSRIAFVSTMGNRVLHVMPAGGGESIRLPLTLVAVFLGMRIIAGEVDGRNLAITYTVPGGCERVWWTKLLASAFVLVAAETLLAVATYVFFTPFPWSALYGAMQAELFYLVLSMGMATLFLSEVAGATGIAAVLGFNRLISGLGENQVRTSPFWNPDALEDADPIELFAWTLQNRIGILLAIAAPSCGPIAESACWEPRAA